MINFKKQTKAIAYFLCKSRDLPLSYERSASKGGGWPITYGRTRKKNNQLVFPS